VYEGANFVNREPVLIFDANGSGRYGFDYEVFALAAGNF
jgi:hypothetical protein